MLPRPRTRRTLASHYVRIGLGVGRARAYHRAMSATVRRGGAGIQSAERVLAILELIGEEPAGLAAADIAERLGLGVSTTYRLLQALTRQQFVTRLPGEHRYILGRTVDALGRALHEQLVASDAARAAVRTLHDEVRAPAYLTVFRGDDIAVAHIADSPERPRIGQLHVGFAESAHVTAFGKLMLAAKDDAGLERFFERHGAPALTRQSTTGLAKLREQLDEVRAQQLAVEVDEYLPKLACIAAPVRSRAGRTVGAVSVSVSSDDFGRRARELERAVRRGAWRVSAELG